jgi:hypothetical protein
VPFRPRHPLLGQPRRARHGPGLLGAGGDPPGTYADLAAPTQNNRSVEWNHGLGETVSALISAGLRIELLHEHDYTLFPRWPDLQVSERHFYRLPEGEPSLPLMYSLRATHEQTTKR